MSLALMALVASASSTTAHTMTPSPIESGRRPAESPQGTTPVPPQVAAAGATAAGGAAAEGTSTGNGATGQPTGPAAPLTSGHPTELPAATGSPAPVTTTDSTGTVGPVSAGQPGGRTTVPEGIAAPGPYPGPGNFEPPTASAIFSAGGGGTVTASATWSGTPSLVLSITCPGGPSGSRSGSSGLSLAVDDAGGVADCQVVIALPTAVSATVEYTLAIQPVPADNAARTG